MDKGDFKAQVICRSLNLHSFGCNYSSLCTRQLVCRRCVLWTPAVAINPSASSVLQELELLPHGISLEYSEGHFKEQFRFGSLSQTEADQVLGGCLLENCFSGSTSSNLTVIAAAISFSLRV